MNTLSPPRYSVIVDKGVMVPMRDGTRLAADIYRPAAEGCFPAVVERTPYNREESVILRTKTPQYLAERGFVFVVQDVRGRFGSEGTWYPFVDDGWGDNRDGYDTIQWVAAQPWCNGKVATAGGSYAGQTQMFLAPTRPPALVCCFVREAASDLAQQWCYRGGAFEWAFNLDWTLRHGANALRRQIDLIQKAVTHDTKRYDTLPLDRSPLMADPFRWFHDLLKRRDDEAFWQQFNFETQYGKIDTPMYHMAGWFDIFLEGSLRNFMGIVKEGRTKATRRNQKLLIGPWTHGPTVHEPAFARYVGDMDFGPDAVFDFNGEMLRWYDYWLNGADTGIRDEPPVRYFLMAANEWRTADTWPPPVRQRVRFYLRGGKSGTAASLNDGVLSIEKPAGKEKADRYRYDPADPVPTVGGNTLYSVMRKGAAGEENPDFSATAGPRDQRPVEPRCLTYTSEPLPADLDVVGPVTLILFASSDGPDTDFMAKLCDVFPDGRSILVADGILRARYRSSRWRPRLLKPGKIYRFEIELWSTAWRFAAGHRLRVAVASSNFPRFDR
ncbi:MAG TPA: CocE/NonD family hydrolase, partial [Gemmataceae bacterium]|nr:CocE/NonD family hydrolase [Gemmataceae bacterium]